jgi:hypothetical protein
MARNSLFPAFARIAYQGANGTHIHTIPLRAPVPSGINPGLWDVRKRDGELTSFEDAMGVYVNLLRVFMPTTVTFIEAELYTMQDETADPMFRQIAPLSIAGQATASTAYALTQTVFSYRSDNGGVGKLMLMESSATPNVRTPWRANSPTTFNNLRQYLLGLDCVIIARDGGDPIATTYVTTKTNDVLRRDALFE